MAHGGPGTSPLREATGDGPSSPSGQPEWAVATCGDLEIARQANAPYAQKTHAALVHGQAMGLLERHRAQDVAIMTLWENSLPLSRFREGTYMLAEIRTIQMELLMRKVLMRDAAPETTQMVRRALATTRDGSRNIRVYGPGAETERARAHHGGCDGEDGVGRTATPRSHAVPPAELSQARLR